MKTLPFNRTAALTLLVWAAASAAHAQETSILWKTVNTMPAVVVPAYAGQPSPFPVAAVPVSNTGPDQAMLDEQQRQRDDALRSAESMMAGGRGILIDTRGLRVGGKVTGTRGSRVLIANEWVAEGQKIKVRTYRSPQAQEAIKTLAEYDSEAANVLTNRLNAELNAHPVLELTLKRIADKSLTFTSIKGTHEIQYNNDSR